MGVDAGGAGWLVVEVKSGGGYYGVKESGGG